MIRRFWRLLVPALTAVLLITGCGTQKAAPAATGSAPTTTAQAPAGPKILRVRQATEGLTLDPARTTDISDWHMINQIYDTLLRFKHGTSELEPALAQSYQVSPDGREYTLKLRQGVKFHRGYGEMTAEDVVFSIMRAKDAKSPWKQDMTVVQKVEAVDPYTVKITLAQPFAPFQYFLANSRPYMSFIVSKKAMEKLGDEFGKQPIGTGPFVLDEWLPRESKMFSANAEYWGGKPKVDKINIKIMGDEATAGLAMEKGEVDIAEFNEPNVLKSLQGKPGVQIVTGKRWHATFLHMNPLVKPLDDIRVRQAIAYGINYKELLDLGFGGFGDLPGCGLIQPGMPGYDAAVNKPYPYDPEKAKQLLAQAGVKGELKLSGVTYTTPWIKNAADIISAQLRKIGVNTDFKSLERAAMNQARVKDDNPLTIVSWTTVPDPDLLTIQHHTGSLPPNGLNISRYKAIDNLIDQARFAPNTEARNKALSAMQQKFCDDVPTITVYHQAYTYAIRSNVQNFKLTGPAAEWFYPVELK